MRLREENLNSEWQIINTETVVEIISNGIRKAVFKEETLATDVYQASYDGTVNLIEGMGEKGGVVGLCGAVTDTNTQSRMKAIEDACKKYPDVNLVQIIGDIDESEASVTAIENILAAKGSEISGFNSTCYYPSVALASILSDEKYSEIHAIGCDTDKAVLDGIRNGALDGTMSQNPWGQAYLATVTLKMLTDGWAFKDGEEFLIDSGSFYITKENADSDENTQMEATMEMAKHGQINLMLRQNKAGKKNETCRKNGRRKKTDQKHPGSNVRLGCHRFWNRGFYPCRRCSIHSEKRQPLQRKRRSSLL